MDDDRWGTKAGWKDGGRDQRVGGWMEVININMVVVISMHDRTYECLSVVRLVGETTV